MADYENLRQRSAPSRCHVSSNENKEISSGRMVGLARKPKAKRRILIYNHLFAWYNVSILQLMERTWRRTTTGGDSSKPRMKQAEKKSAKK